MSLNHGFDYDIVIVGGGMVGASLAYALKPAGCRVCLVEAVPRKADQQPSYDDRNLALSLSSRRILEALGLWQALSRNTTAIKHIHVSDQHRPGMVRMSAAEMGLEALGHVVLARDLGGTLLQGLEGCVQELMCPARVVEIENRPERVSVRVAGAGPEQILTARLLILADGSNSRTRALCGFELENKFYGQTAIVSNVMTELPHNHTAYERFTGSGPFALLPSSHGRMAMVFTVDSREARRYLELSDAEFETEIQKQFGRRLGRISKPGKRNAYEISMHQVRNPFRHRTLLLGNSAHTLHPNAAQGFNLALRDVAGLAEVLGSVAAADGDPGAESSLMQYQSLREPDQKRVLSLTDGLARSFYNTNPCLVFARNLGLMATELLPALKHRIALQGAGLNSRYHYLPVQ